MIQVKKLKKDILNQWEHRKEEKNFRPVPEKYYKEDEGLAVTAGGGFKAIIEQQHRIEELEQEKEDERIAREIERSEVSLRKSLAPDEIVSNQNSSTTKSLLLDKKDDEERKDGNGKSVKVEPLKPLKNNIKNEISKTITDLFTLELGLGRDQFLSFSIETVLSNPKLVKYDVVEVEHFCKNEVNKLYPSIHK